jgi:hypothetical protein
MVWVPGTRDPGLGIRNGDRTAGLISSTGVHHLGVHEELLMPVVDRT